MHHLRGGKSLGIRRGEPLHCHSKTTDYTTLSPPCPPPPTPPVMPFSGSLPPIRGISPLRPAAPANSPETDHRNPLNSSTLGPSVTIRPASPMSKLASSMSLMTPAHSPPLPPSMRPRRYSTKAGSTLGLPYLPDLHHKQPPPGRLLPAKARASSWWSAEPEFTAALAPEPAYHNAIDEERPKSRRRRERGAPQ